MYKRDKILFFITLLLEIGYIYIVGTRSLYQCINSISRLEPQIWVFWSTGYSDFINYIW